ncbi:hypothetical protein T09_12162 [Trichinella sp. T9]|nr:hypothetical protein T09_12162 [Trichinella sp. T9]
MLHHVMWQGLIPRCPTLSQSLEEHLCSYGERRQAPNWIEDSHCIPSVFQRWLLLEPDLSSTGTVVNASCSLLAHLCKWKPPLANSPASSLASLIVSYDVARSSTYMFSKISVAARGAASW